MIQVAVMGYGTVGSGVVEVIEKNKEEINKKSNEALNIKYILDLRDFPGDPYEDKIVHDVEVILNDPEVQIICETMGGLKPAYEFTKRALMSGKSVCTSNKELVATHGPELIQIATNQEFSENTKKKHIKDAKYGWYRYDVRFALPVYDDKTGQLVRYNIFSARMLVRHDEDGKKYLYDLLAIKKETSSPLES